MIRLTEEYLERAARVLATSFREEPVFLSMFLEPQTRDGHIHDYMEMSVRLAILYGDAYATSERTEGVLIGSRSTMSASTRSSLQRDWSESLLSKYGNNLFRRIKSITDEMYKVLDRNISGDRIYFWMLGVDPPLQGKGYGSQLLKEVLAEIDSEKLPCYLETHSEENVRLYERHGFRVAEDLILPEANIRHCAMVRPGC